MERKTPLKKNLYIMGALADAYGKFIGVPFKIQELPCQSRNECVTLRIVRNHENKAVLEKYNEEHQYWKEAEWVYYSTGIMGLWVIPNGKKEDKADEL